MLGLGLSINRQRVMGGPAVPPPTINSVTIDVTTPTVGDTLTATVDATDADSITYQWKADGVNIGGETAQTYLTTRDGAMGRAITVTAVARKTGAANSAPMTSSATSLVKGAPEFTSNPVITTDGVNAPDGPADNGDTLTSTDGVYSGYPAPTVSYQWYGGAGTSTPLSSGNPTTALGFYGSNHCVVSLMNTVGSTSADSNLMLVNP